MSNLSGDKYAFLKMQPPAAYVAGLGRGASGFTTRSDIGPAREGPSEETIAAAQAARGEAPDDDDDPYRDPDNESGLFAGSTYDADDQEADDIYAEVDRKMEERRRARREKAEKEEEEKARKERPPIQEQFADLKRGLSAVTDDEWATLPESANATGKRRKKEREGLYVTPDSILLGARDANSMQSSLDAQQMAAGEKTAEDGLANLKDIGVARTTLLGLDLDKMSKAETNGTSTSVDKEGYLTSLNSVIPKSESEIGDTKRARMLFKSLTQSNPTHAPGWIAAASLESLAGRMVAARKIIAEGCEKCPKSDEIWLAAAQLNTNDNAKIILAKAVQNIPQSVAIWLAAADLENENGAKKRVLRKALEYIPNSVKLWKAAVSLEEDPNDARTLLGRAVELIPTSIELWLTLARLETPDRARKVINSARKAIPTSHEIWIAACRLQEQEGKVADLDKLMTSALSNLKRNGVELPRDEWIKEAWKCEANGSVHTAQSILRATLHIDVDEEDRFDKWIEDAEAAMADGKIESARAIYAYSLNIFPNKPNLWRRASDLEKRHGSRESLMELLKRATISCPNAESLWLLAAKEASASGDISQARTILGDAFAANPNNEEIWLAATELEAENNELGPAKTLLQKARSIAGTERIWIKSAVFERLHGTFESALETVNQALAKYPNSPKLYMIKGQMLQDRKDVAGARQVFATGLKFCPQSVTLWLLSSRLEESANIAIKARSLLEKARTTIKKNPELWLESVKVEERTGSLAQAKTMMARALQECPASGILWSESVWQEARALRKTKMVDALKKSNNDPVVLVTVARIFWMERKVDKARNWFDRAVTADPDLGDAWGWWLKFEQEHGGVDTQKSVIDRCVLAEPKHGTTWQQVSKDPRLISRKSTRDILNDVVKLLQ